MAINPSRIPRQFIEAAQKRKREENQKKAAQDTEAIRGAFGSGGDKMDYQSSAPARKKVEEQKAKTDAVSKRGKASRARKNFDLYYLDSIGTRLDSFESKGAAIFLYSLRK